MQSRFVCALFRSRVKYAASCSRGLFQGGGWHSPSDLTRGREPVACPLGLVRVLLKLVSGASQPEV